jgi:Mn2+/Fe2+ NRAMP family transporter
VASRFASQLFALGLLGVSALAAAVVPFSTWCAVSKTVGAERSVGKRFCEAKLFLGLFTGQIVVGSAVALISGNLIELLVQAQVINGVIIPILLTYVLVLANRRTLLGTAANGPVLRAIATVSVAIIVVMATAVLGLTAAG